MDIYTVASQEILERISRHCPHALPTYLHCLNRSVDGGTTFFSRFMVEEEMSESWTKFRNQIKKLATENLLEWHPFNGGIAVTLALEENE